MLSRKKKKSLLGEANWNFLGLASCLAERESDGSLIGRLLQAGHPMAASPPPPPSPRLPPSLAAGEAAGLQGRQSARALNLPSSLFQTCCISPAACLEDYCQFCSLPADDNKIDRSLPAKQPWSHQFDFF